ncbi:hypothetical protein SCALM49S_05144 [Streptomyces californicus]
MRLCPQAWPRPGRASYSQAMATVTGPEPMVARNAVSRPWAGAVTSKPCAARSPAHRAADLCSSKAVSGSACRLRLSSSRAGA